MADYMVRLDFVVLDELGYLPFAQSRGQLLLHNFGFNRSMADMTRQQHNKRGPKHRIGDVFDAAIEK